MPEGFNELERAVLRWFQQHYGNQRLSVQIESAKLIKRDWTEKGSYVYFEVSKELPPIDLNDFEGRWPINGPELRSADIQQGGGSILWGKSGYAECIEMYAFDGYFNEHVKDFELSP